MNIKKNIPNILSTTRLIMALGIPYVFATCGSGLGALYYLAGNATDAVDGFLARKWKAQSKYGKVVDPAADKLFNLTSLVCAAISLGNPLLWGILIGEVAIAKTIGKHGKRLIKDKKSNNTGKKAKLFDRIKERIDILNSLSVSRIGRKKAIFMVLSVFTALFARLIPVLSPIATILATTTLVLEVPTILEYVFGYKKYIGNITKKGIKTLNFLNKLDNAVDKIDEVVKTKSKSLVNKVRNFFGKPKKNENINVEQSEPSTCSKEDIIEEETEPIQQSESISPERRARVIAIAKEIEEHLRKANELSEELSPSEIKSLQQCDDTKGISRTLKYN